MIIASLMSDFNMFLGLVVFCVGLPIALMVSLAQRTLKKNDELREKVKDVAKKKGQEALMKGIEWLLKKK